MRIITGIKNINISEPTVITIGIFDGLHIGHKKILRLLKKRAKSLNAKSCVVTFDPHPAKILYPGRAVPTLVSTQHKLSLLAAEEVDYVVLIKFSKDFAKMDWRQFTESILVDRLNIKELLVGKEFSFGRGKKGTVDALKDHGTLVGYKVRGIEPVKYGNDIVSSTLIRRLVSEGNIKRANVLLGRRVSILGTVIKGSRRGRILGFPTANLDMHHEAIPPSGVYIVKVNMRNRSYNGILNIGFRPTFDRRLSGRATIVEVHIFGFHRDIYGKDLEVLLLRRIRSERKFKDKNHLLDRITRDIKIANKYFSGEGAV